MSGFVPANGTDFHSGAESQIAQRLDALAKKLGVTIYGISGARSPQHSLDVGGFANDPHTTGQAADIGVNSMLRSSAGSLTDAQLASVGLYRPFGGPMEINHVQLKPGTNASGTSSSGGGGVSLGSAIGAGAGSGALLGSFAGPEGTAIGAVGGAIIGGIGSVIAGPAEKAAGDAAANAAIATTEAVIGSSTFQHAALYVVLVVGGLALLVVGVSRAAGVKPPNPLRHMPVPVPV